jgi:hypothetical protein
MKWRRIYSLLKSISKMRLKISASNGLASSIRLLAKEAVKPVAKQSMAGGYVSGLLTAIRRNGNNQ